MKKLYLQKSCVATFLTFIFYTGLAQITPKQVVWWNFDSCNSRIFKDEVSNANDSINGNFSLTTGTCGKALKLDGFTTSVTRKAGKVPQLGGSFTFEAPIAAATYPWSWLSIIAREKKILY